MPSKEIGSTIYVDVTLTNTGGEDATFDVEAEYSGPEYGKFGSRLVHVWAGDSRTLSFSKTFNIPGFYDVCVWAEVFMGNSSDIICESWAFDIYDPYGYYFY